MAVAANASEPAPAETQARCLLSGFTNFERNARGRAQKQKAYWGTVSSESTMSRLLGSCKKVSLACKKLRTYPDGTRFYSGESSDAISTQWMNPFSIARRGKDSPGLLPHGKKLACESGFTEDCCSSVCYIAQRAASAMVSKSLISGYRVRFRAASSGSHSCRRRRSVCRP